MAKKQMGYVEPTEFFPKEIRKKFKLGEFAENSAETKSKSSGKSKSAKKPTKKK